MVPMWIVSSLLVQRGYAQPTPSPPDEWLDESIDWSAILDDSDLLQQVIDTAAWGIPGNEEFPDLWDAEPGEVPAGLEQQGQANIPSNHDDVNEFTASVLKEVLGIVVDSEDINNINPSSRVDAASSRISPPSHAGPSSSRAGPSSSQAGPSSNQAGPSSRLNPAPAEVAPSRRKQHGRGNPRKSPRVDTPPSPTERQRSQTSPRAAYTPNSGEDAAATETAPVLPRLADPGIVTIESAGIPQKYVEAYVEPFSPELLKRNTFGHIVSELKFVMGKQLAGIEHPVHFYQRGAGANQEGIVEICLDMVVAHHRPPGSNAAVNSFTSPVDTLFPTRGLDGQGSSRSLAPQFPNGDVFAPEQLPPINFIPLIENAVERDGRDALIAAIQDAIDQSTMHIKSQVMRSSLEKLIKITVYKSMSATYGVVPRHLAVMMNHLRKARFEAPKMVREFLEITPTQEAGGPRPQPAKPFTIYRDDPSPSGHSDGLTFKTFENHDRVAKNAQLTKGLLQTWETYFEPSGLSAKMIADMGVDAIVLCFDLKRDNRKVTLALEDSQLGRNRGGRTLFVDLEVLRASLPSSAILEKATLMLDALKEISPDEFKTITDGFDEFRSQAIPIALQSPLKPEAYSYVVIELQHEVSDSARRLVDRYRRDYGKARVLHLGFGGEVDNVPSLFNMEEYTGALPGSLVKAQWAHNVNHKSLRFVPPVHPVAEGSRVFDAQTKLILVGKGGSNRLGPTVAGMGPLTLAGVIAWITHQNEHLVFWPKAQQIQELRILACEIEPEENAGGKSYGRDLYDSMRLLQDRSARTELFAMKKLTTYRGILWISERGLVFSRSPTNNDAEPEPKRTGGKRTFVLNHMPGNNHVVEVRRPELGPSKRMVRYHRMHSNPVLDQHLGTDASNRMEEVALPEQQGENDHKELLPFEDFEALSADSWEELTARTNLAHMCVALHAWVAGVGVKVRRSMAHIVNTLGIRKRLVPILSTASVVDGSRNDYEMDVLILPESAEDTHVFVPWDLRRSRHNTIRRVSLDSDAFIKVREMIDAAKSSNVAEIVDRPQGGSRTLVGETGGVSNVESPSTLAAGLLILTLSRMANQGKSRHFGMNKQLSLALELHNYMNMAQISIDVTHNAFTICRILDELYSMTRIAGSLLVRKVITPLQSMSPGIAETLGGLNTAIILGSIAFDIYEIIAAEHDMQVNIYTTQLLVDVTTFTFLQTCQAFPVSCILMMPLVGVAIGVTSVITVLVEATANAVHLGGYFNQFDYDYSHPFFFEYDADTNLQEVNMAFTSFPDARARVNTAVVTHINLRAADSMMLDFGSQLLYRNSRWHKDTNFAGVRSEHMDRTAPMINVRRALGNADRISVPHHSDTAVFTLPISATSFIEYHYGPAPAIYWKDDENLEAVRRIQANYPFYFEFWGVDMESLSKLTLKYQPSTIQVTLGSYPRTLLMPSLPDPALYDKLTYDITLDNPRIAHTLKVVEHAQYTVRMTDGAVRAATQILHGFSLLLAGNPNASTFRAERKNTGANRDTTIIHIHGIAITFIGKFGEVHIIGNKFRGTVDLSPGGVDSPQLLLSEVGKEYFEKHREVVSEHVTRNHGFVQIAESTSNSLTWYDFAAKTYITAPPLLAIKHPHLELLNRIGTFGDVVYFAPPNNNSREVGEIYIVSNSTGVTSSITFCCPMAFPIAATFSRNDLLRVRLSDGLTLAVDPTVNTQTIIGINVSRKLSISSGAPLTRALFIHFLHAIASETQYRIGDVAMLFYDDKDTPQDLVQSWYIASTGEFLDVHQPSNRDRGLPVRLLGWDRDSSDATSTYFLFEPTTRTIYKQRGTHMPMRSSSTPGASSIELNITDITDVSSNGIHAFVHYADGSVSRLSANGPPRLSTVNLSKRTLSLTPTPFIDVAWKSSSMPVVHVRESRNVYDDALNVWYIVALDAVVVGDGPLARNDTVFLGEISMTCYALDVSTRVVYRQTPLKGRNRKYYEIADRKLRFVRNTPANVTTPHKWIALQFPQGITLLSATIRDGAFLIITTSNLLFAVNFEADYTPTLTLIGLTDAWVSEQVTRYPSERLSDAVHATVSRVDQQVAPQVMVGMRHTPQRLYDVAHSTIVTSSPDKEFLGLRKPRPNRAVENDDITAYYFSPRTKMVIKEALVETTSTPSSSLSFETALPVIAADHAFAMGNTLVVNPRSPHVIVPSALPRKSLVVLGSSVGVDDKGPLDSHDTIVVTSPDDPLNASMHYTRPPLKDFVPVYQGGQCEDINCEPIVGILACINASVSVFGNTLYPLDRTALERNTKDSFDLTHGCSFRDMTLVDETCPDVPLGSHFGFGCLCRCPNGPSSPTTHKSSPLACTTPRGAQAYDFSQVSADPLTHFAATGITCARGFVMSAGGIVVTPCVISHTNYAVRGCVAPPTPSAIENTLTVRASTYAAADIDCVGAETTPAQVYEHWAHVGSCMLDAGTGKYRVLACLAPGTLDLRFFSDANCENAIENHRITRGECSAATWWLTEEKEISNTIWDWSGVCVRPPAPEVEGECKKFLGTLTYNNEVACREEGCDGARSCSGYIYDSATRACLLYQYVARPGTRCKERTHACQAKLYNLQDEQFALIRAGSISDGDFRQLYKMTVRSGCEVSFIPHKLPEQDPIPVQYQSDASWFTDRETWPDRGSIQYVTVRALYTCLGERCHSTCGTSLFWPHTAWCWTDRNARHPTVRRWGICKCEKGQEDGTPIRGRHWISPCVFPYIYNGHTYGGYGGDACVESDDGLPSWCATSVYNDRSYKTYGYCDNTNPKKTACRGNRRGRRQLTSSSSRRGRKQGPRRLTGNEANCVFPFRFRGRVHFACTHMFDDPHQPAWCSTKVDDDGNHVSGAGNYGYCDDSCDVRHLGTDNDRLCMQQFGPLHIRWHPFGDSLYGVNRDNECPINTEACVALGPERRGDVAEKCTHGCANGKCATFSCEFYTCPNGTAKKSPAPATCNGDVTEERDRATCCCTGSRSRTSTTKPTALSAVKCSTHTCPNGWEKDVSKTNTACWGDPCYDTECCIPVCGDDEAGFLIANTVMDTRNGVFVASPMNCRQAAYETRCDDVAKTYCHESCGLCRESVPSGPRDYESEYDAVTERSRQGKQWCQENRAMEARYPVPEVYRLLYPTASAKCARMCSSYGTMCHGFTEDGIYCYLFGFPALWIRRSYGLIGEQPLTHNHYAPTSARGILCYKKRM